MPHYNFNHQNGRNGKKKGGKCSSSNNQGERSQAMVKVEDGAAMDGNFYKNLNSNNNFNCNRGGGKSKRGNFNNNPGGRSINFEGQKKGPR